MAKKRVQVGQVYQSVGTASGRNWRVVSTVDVYGIPHARVVSAEDEGDMKTLSCLILTDTTHYRLLPGESAAA
jgi:hypothetical protein